MNQTSVRNDDHIENLDADFEPRWIQHAASLNPYTESSPTVLLRVLFAVKNAVCLDIPPRPEGVGFPDSS